jgi:NADH-quinone oxidoreductase subunit E
MWTGRKTMLSEEEKKEMEVELQEYEQKNAACIEAMKIVQRHRGWLSDEAIRDISEFFGMTPDELDSVATFYSLIFRKPVGEHVILICDSISCWIMGYEKIIRHLKARLGIELGETTADGKFTLLPVACIGACDEAPALIIDGEVYGNLDESKIDDILFKYG